MRDVLSAVSIWSAFFFFFNDTATTEIYTLSLHDALPISCWPSWKTWASWSRPRRTRSEEHTSELQSQSNLVCRLLLEKKKKKKKKNNNRVKNRRTLTKETLTCMRSISHIT